MRSVLSRVFRYGVATVRCDKDVAADLRGAIAVPKVKHFAAITRPSEVGALLRAIDGYGQRHRVELDCREAFRASVIGINPAWTARLGPDHLLDLSILGQVSETALTRDAEIALRDDGLPNTFVPGRNLLFFTLAAALAYTPASIAAQCAPLPTIP
jgi:7-cyano-7-deazaguanine synthase in queuosine biosynthesis